MSESRSDNERKHASKGASAPHRGGKGRTKGEGSAHKVEAQRSAMAAEPAIAHPEETAPEPKLAIMPPKPEAPKTEAPKAEAKMPVDVGRTRQGELFLTLQMLSVKWAARGLGWGCMVLVGGARALENGAMALEQASQRLDELQEKIKNNEIRAAA
jgi:hypothetical protein